MLDEPSTDTRPAIFRIADLLEGRRARLALATLVIISLLPLGAIDLALRPLFFAVFGADLVVRLLVWRADVHGTRAVTVSAVVLGICDLVAFITFLPLELWIDDRDLLSLLSLLRLTRLLMLVRFGRGVVRDLYAIVTRREQVQTLAFVTGAVVMLSLVSAIIVTHLSLRVTSHEEEPFRERFWWSFRQIESPDNLVSNLEGEPIVIALSVALTLAGVFLVAFIIGVGSNVVDQLVRAERRRDLTYRGHTVIIGAVHDGEELIREFVRMYAKNRQVPSPERLLTWLRHLRPTTARTLPHVALLSRQDEMPDFLVEPIMRWVVYRQGDQSEPESLRRIAAKNAKRAIILAERTLGHETDAVTISALAALRAENKECHAYVEVDDGEAKDIVLQVGGDNTVALDVPRFLGMFLCQHLLMPGAGALYRDLLTSEGSELYTHIYTDPDDDAARARLPETLRFDDVAAAAQRLGVQLLGLYLGDKPVRTNAKGVVPVAGLVRWLNPNDDVRDEALLALGAARGVIPTRTLRGLIALAESYLPLRALASSLCDGSLEPLAPRSAEDDVVVARATRALAEPPRGPRRIALIGASDSVPSLLRELSFFVPNVEVTLFLSARGGERTPLTRRLARLGVGIKVDDDLPGDSGRTVSLARGGRLTIFTHDAPDLARFAASHLKDRPPLDAAVFLCEAEGADKDARTAMRVLRFVSLLEQGTIPHGDRMHVVAEFISVDKGLYLQRHVDSRACGFDSNDALRLTLIAKETVKSYFMVHSSFVPGVSDIYDELLEERGQDVVRFAWHGVDGEEVRLSHIAVALRERAAVPLAVQRKNGTIVTCINGDAALDSGDISGVFAIAESALFSTYNDVGETRDGGPAALS